MMERKKKYPHSQSSKYLVNGHRMQNQIAWKKGKEKKSQLHFLTNYNLFTIIHKHCIFLRQHNEEDRRAKKIQKNQQQKNHKNNKEISV